MILLINSSSFLEINIYMITANLFSIDSRLLMAASMNRKRCMYLPPWSPVSHAHKWAHKWPMEG